MDDPGKKADAVRQLVKRVPGFAPAWKEQAMQVGADAEKLAAIEKGLAANPDDETKGILLINKALITDRSGDHEGAVRLLGELALDPASTYATEHLAKVTLASIAKKFSLSAAAAAELVVRWRRADPMDHAEVMNSCDAKVGDDMAGPFRERAPRTEVHLTGGTL